MASFQELSFWPHLVVDDEDDFFSLLLPNNLTGENHPQMSNVEKNVQDMQVFPYDNKDKAKSDKNNWDPQIHQLSGTPDQQLTESERIDLMTEDEKLDYLADLALEEPCQLITQPQQLIDKGMNNMLEESYQPKTQPQQQQSNKGMNNSEFDESNTAQIGNLENSKVENTVQYSEVKKLSTTDTQKYKITWNSDFLTPILNNEILGDKNLTHLHHVHHQEKNNDTMDKSSHQNKTPDQKINQSQSKEVQFELQNQTLHQKINQSQSKELQFELQNQTLHQNLQGRLNSQQCQQQFQNDNQEDNGDIEILNEFFKEPQWSINLGVDRKVPMGVNLEMPQNKIDNKTIPIQHTTPCKNYEKIINKNIKHVQVAPAQKETKKNGPFTIDRKYLLKLLQSHSHNKVVLSPKTQVIHNISPIQNINTHSHNKVVLSPKTQIIHNISPVQSINTLQNELKLPMLNKEIRLPAHIGELNMSSNVAEVKPNMFEKINPETSCMKKRKKYEEDPNEDEEEEKRRLQAKKAKHYRDKKKEELKMKDVQIKQLQEELQKREIEKTAYMAENKQLKEEIKRKDLLLQLYE